MREPRTARQLFPRWAIVTVPLLALAVLVAALAAGSGGDGGGRAGPADVGAALPAAADDLDRLAATAAAGDDEAARLGRRVEVLAAIARGEVPARPPDWAAAGLEPGASLQGAGVGFEAQAAGEQAPDRLLRWLVLAEAERARVLDLPDLATGLEQVVADLGEG